jgi:hypothetical protein
MLKSIPYQIQKFFELQHFDLDISHQVDGRGEEEKKPQQ